EDWPRWRGPRLDGISQETGLLKEWPNGGPRQLWRAPLSGGFSSLVVADSRLFTQTKEKNQEVVVCLDGDGKRSVVLPLRMRLHSAPKLYGRRHAGLADRSPCHPSCGR